MSSLSNFWKNANGVFWNSFMSDKTFQRAKSIDEKIIWKKISLETEIPQGVLFIKRVE